MLKFQYFIEIPTGKLYFDSHIDFDENVDNICILNSKDDLLKRKFWFVQIYDCDHLDLFLKNYVWDCIEIRPTINNGMFLFIRLSDDHYGEPMFKIYKNNSDKFLMFNLDS